LADQELSEYDRFNREFIAIMPGNSLRIKNILNDRQRKMFYAACYNLDSFRQFIFKSTFFQRFKIDDGLRIRLQTNDIELMAFAGRWLHFFLIGENTLHIQNPAPVRRDFN